MYAHPPTRAKLHSLPELTENSVKEVWQAEKWLYDVPNEILTPMVRVRDKDFYIHELLYCTSGTWFIPQRFFEHENKRLAVGHVANPSQVIYLRALDGIKSCS